MGGLGGNRKSQTSVALTWNLDCATGLWKGQKMLVA